MTAVAAIVLNHRKAELTDRCLRSLHGQAGLERVYVVDNSASEAHAAELDARLVNHPTVHLLRPAGNLGFAAGVNAALAADAGAHEAYLLLNNDAEATPGMLAALRAHLACTPTLAAVAPLCVPAAGLPPLIHYQRHSGLLSARAWPGTFPYLCGACLLVRRDACDAGGRLFDERFFMYGEDVALGWRLWRAGRDIAVVDAAVCRHLGSASARHGSLFYEYHVLLGHLRLVEVLADTPATRHALLALRGLVLGLRSLWRACRWRSRHPLTAWRLAWRDRDRHAPTAVLP